jgi:DNA-directed RNA polymerase sigma subunit (sigma70/sigma32)
LEEETEQEEPEDDNSKKHQKAIQNLLAELSQMDALVISEYLFQSYGEVSLSALAKKYSLPKTTVHHKIESFKKKISKNYSPENKEDGIFFINNLSFALNELAKQRYKNN